MENRRYELADEQLEQVKDMMQHFKMGRPPKDDFVFLCLNFLPILKEESYTLLAVDDHKIHQSVLEI